LFGVRRQGRAAAVNLDPDLEVGIRRRLTAWNQSLTDLLESLLDRHGLGKAVRPHLDAAAAEVGDQFDKALARLDVLFDFGRIGGVEFTGRSASPDVDARVGKALPDFLALRFGKGWFDTVLVARAQLHGRQADTLADFEDGRNI